MAYAKQRSTAGGYTQKTIGAGPPVNSSADADYQGQERKMQQANRARAVSNSPSTPWSPGGRKNRMGG